MKSSNFLPAAALIVTACVCFGVRHAEAQAVNLTDVRIQKLEARVATLEADNARLKSAVTVDANKNVAIDATTVSIKAAATLTEQAGTAASIKGTTITLN